MRILSEYPHRYTQVLVLDEPGSGNGCHEYVVRKSPVEGLPNQLAGGEVADLHFQDGPIKEVGINGCMDENLIAIVIDRLQGFQSGVYKCRENAIALTKLEEAMLWLNKRTNDRTARGVEGTHTV